MSRLLLLRVVVALTILLGANYVVWRWLESVNWSAWWIAVPLVIAETRHGFVCASAGVDASNAKGPDTLVLLPVDPDASARGLRERIRALAGVEVGVIVSDSFGRAWRRGTTDVALGVAGLVPLLDLVGVRDAQGYELHGTEIAVADEIAGAAELVMGKTRGIPAAIVRGPDVAGDGAATDLVMPRDRDLFR